MAAGKPTGEFSFKMVGMTNTSGPAGSVLVQVNFEGTASGFGAVFDTCTFIGGGKDGTFSEVGSAYLENGDLLTGVGQGTYESKGKHRWTTSATMQISDGRRFANHGELDLAARTWKSTNTEIS